MFKQKIRNKLIFFYFTILFSFIFIVLIFTPGIKGNLEQELRIITKNPIIIDTNKKILFNISNFYISLGDIFKSNNFEKIKININYINFDKLRKDREKSLKKGMLINPTKVDLNVEWQNKKYPAVARLKGDFNDHRNYNKQWSLKINLKNSKTILGMNEFSIQNHKSRNFPFNFLISKNLNRVGLNVPEFHTFNVNLNGYDWGLMLAEEHFTKEYLEKRKLKNNIIFKLSYEEKIKFEHLYLNKNIISNDEFKYLTKWIDIFSVDFHNKSKILKKNDIVEKKRLLNFYSLMQTLNEEIYFNDSRANNILIDKYFDVQAFARMFVSSLAWGEADFHSMSLNNTRFYINPYTLKITPIPADYDFIFLQGYKLNEIQESINKLPYFYKHLIKHKNFQISYLEAVAEFEKEFSNIFNDHQQICKQYNEICLKLFDKQKLIKNVEKLKKYNTEIFNGKRGSKNKELISNNNKNYSSLYTNHINARIFENGIIKIKNLTPYEIKVNSLEIKNKYSIEKLNIVLNPSINEIFKIEKKSKRKLNLNDVVILKYSLTNYDKVKIYELIVEDSKYLSLNKILKNNLENIINKNIFIEDKTIVFDGSEHIINNFVEFPKNYNLKILPGATLKFRKNSGFLINNGTIQINGTSASPIRLEAFENYWRGIHLIGNNKKSTIKNTIISDLDYFIHNGYFLTGGINIYKANIDISNSRFENIKSEDALNLIKSKFTINECYFDKIISDAIDIDFSNGKITNSYFSNINGDGIDTSGSEIEIFDIKFNNIGDKALSIGEKSFINAYNITINNAKIGIASKDGSKFYGKKIHITNSKLLNLAAYNKKSIYNGANIELEETSLKNKILSQFGSQISINNKIITNEKVAMKELY